MIIRVKNELKPIIYRFKQYEIIKIDEKYEEFVGLIEWASNYYSRKVPYSYVGRNDFVGTGYIVLSNCIQKWDGRGNDKKFAKYFKTSLFNAYKNMLAKIYSNKQRTQVNYTEDEKEKVFYPDDESIHDLDLKAKNDGFGALFYEDLIKHVHGKIRNPIEKKIFIALVDPPEELCVEAITENRRKLKASINRTVNGVNKVKASSGIIIKYLKKNGSHVSKSQYQSHLKNVRDIVREILSKDE
jgi:hypothetical protein